MHVLRPTLYNIRSPRYAIGLSFFENSIVVKTNVREKHQSPRLVKRLRRFRSLRFTIGIKSENVPSHGEVTMVIGYERTSVLATR